MTTYYYHYRINKWIPIDDEDLIPYFLENGMVVITSMYEPTEEHIMFLMKTMFHAVCDTVAI